MTDAGELPDRQWQSQLFADLENPLMAYVTSLLHDPDRASDVVQDAFVRLCSQSRENLEGRERQWLYTVCRNRAFDILKKERRMKTLDDCQAVTQIGQDDPIGHAVHQEVVQQANSLLDDLPDKQREVIRLKVQSGLSYREISDLTGLSISNVGYLLHTGLKSIRNRMAPTE